MQSSLQVLVDFGAMHWGVWGGREGDPRVQCLGAWGGVWQQHPVPHSPLHIWPVPSQVAVPTQDVVGTPARLNTHRWEQVPSSMRLAGRTGKVPAAAASTLSAS